MAYTSSCEFNKSNLNSLNVRSNESLSEQCIEELAHMLSKQSVLGNKIAKLLPGVICEKLIERLKDFELLNDNILKQIVNSNIQRLIINRSSTKNYISPEALHESILKCEDLEKLNCSGQLILSKTIDYITQRMKLDIKELDVHRCGLTNLQTKKILRSCTSLETIDLSGNRFIQSDCFDLFDDKKNVSHTFQSNENILLLYNCIFDDFNLCLQQASRKRKKNKSKTFKINTKKQKINEITSNKIKSKKERYWNNKHMKEINLAGCIRINNDSIRSLSRIFSNLMKINLSHCKSVTDITCIIRQCQLLTSIIIDDCPIVTYEVKGEYLKNLKELSFSGKGQLTIEFFSWFKNCKDKLEVLRLRNKTFNGDGNLFTDLVREFSNIKILDLYGADIKSSFTELLSTHLNLRKSLVSLDITFGEGITVTEVIEKIISKKIVPFLNLESFSFSANISTNTTPLDQDVVRHTFPCLENLCIYRSKSEKGISQVEIAKLLSCFPNLINIEIWCCSTISYLLLGIIPGILKNVKRVLLCSKDNNVPQPTYLNYALEPQIEDGHNFQSILNSNQLEILQKKFPNVEYLLWKHTVKGSRNFLHINPKYPVVETNVIKINVEPFKNTYKATIIVDDIPIWANENRVNLDHMKSIIDKQGGSIPIVEDWCCECNVDDFIGILYYHDEQHIYWEVKEPGPKSIFKFNKNQYRREVIAALEKSKAFCDS